MKRFDSLSELLRSSLLQRNLICLLMYEIVGWRTGSLRRSVSNTGMYGVNIPPSRSSQRHLSHLLFSSVLLSVFLPSLNDWQAKHAMPHGGALLGQYQSTGPILFIGFNDDERRLHSPYNANVFKQFASKQQQ
uniref:Uncharacterized protein n=1 Tax=Glossina austeni TaxID=7395 RepID=A0A1A9VFR4_GLOAU